MARVEKLSRSELQRDYPMQSKLYPIDFRHPLCFFVLNQPGSTFVYPREVKKPATLDRKGK